MSKVHIGFGFHVNCYHSYRGDTNDALGFGGDIRIMRHITPGRITRSPLRPRTWGASAIPSGGKRRPWS